jgi:hypothetical protein
MKLPILHPPDGGKNNQAHPVDLTCPACPFDILNKSAYKCILIILTIN